MNAKIIIPISKTAAQEAIKTLEGEGIKGERVNTELKATSKGLEIIIKARDVTSMRAALNTTLKLYQVHEEVKKKCQKTMMKQEIKWFRCSNSSSKCRH